MRAEVEDWDQYLDAEPPEDALPDADAAGGKLPDGTETMSPVPDKAILRTPLANLHLSERTLRLLEGGGVRTLGQLVHLCPSQLKNLPGFGRKAQQEVGEALDYFGLELRPEPLPGRVAASDRGKGSSPARKKPAVRSLCLPEMEALPRLCAGCRQALLPPGSRERFCSRACRWATRAARPKPSLPAPSDPGVQLALAI